MKLEAIVYGEKVEVEKDDMIAKILNYYDCAGIKHMHLEIDDMSDEEIVELYENAFAR